MSAQTLSAGFQDRRCLSCRIGKEPRDWYRGEHPPACTCVPCTKARIAARRKEEQIGEMKRAFLILLVVVCLAVAAWNAYLLFTNQTNPLTGWIILAVSIGVVFWNISVLRAYRIRTITVVAVLLITALIAGTVGAFAGVEPFAGIKDSVVSRIGDIFVRSEDAAAQRVVRATIDAFNKGRGDRLADLTTPEVYNILTDVWVGDHPFWGCQIVEYTLTTLRSGTVVPSGEDWYEIRVRGGVRDPFFGFVEPYDYVYTVVRMFDGDWVVTGIVPMTGN